MEEATGAPSSFAVWDPKRLRASGRDGETVMTEPPSPLRMLLSRHTRLREFICLFGAMAAAWSIAAYAQESATMPATSGTTASLPQIELARVKPVDQMPPNVRLSDDLIDLMKAFSLSSAEGIGRAWGAPLRPPTPFDERFGQWETRLWPK